MSGTPTHERLSQAIREHGARYLREGRAASLYEVNDGMCEDFAQDVVKALGGETDRFEGWWADGLSLDGEGGGWDVGLLARLFPLCVPTHGLSWDDVAGTVPAHYWLVLDGRHHDAECPDGVDNLFELPLMRRVMERLARAAETSPPQGP